MNDPIRMADSAPNSDHEGSLETEFGCATAEILHAPARTVLRLPLPRMGGNVTERLFRSARRIADAQGFCLYETDGLLLGCSVVPVDGGLTAATRDLYHRMLAACSGRALYRIWNYVPAINAERDGQENYRAFCIGRAQAFETAYGAGFPRVLPAASGVGSDGKTLAVLFVAGQAPPRHFENPDQVSAYHYPPEHGERSPSFARATVATYAGRPLVFLSGTAAIKGHATVAPDSLPGQLDCTLDNLRIIGGAIGVGETLGSRSAMTRYFKVYLRHASDLDHVRARLERELFRPGDQVVYLRADICRAALTIEIEATLVG